MVPCIAIPLSGSKVLMSEGQGVCIGGTSGSVEGQWGTGHDVYSAIFGSHKFLPLIIFNYLYNLFYIFTFIH